MRRALYDDDTLAHAARSIARLLDEIARDDDALAALARAGARDA